MIWLSSDIHFGEERLQLFERPFKNSDEMNEKIIESFNSVVSPDDDLILVGDICNQNHPEKLPLVGMLNGRKTLIRGNHDRPITDEQFLRYFAKVIPENKGLKIELGGVPCYVTHYPTNSVQNRFNLVGHIHGAFKVQLNMLNVSVDVHHFLPINEELIAFYYKAIIELYDDDVWAAYGSANMSYIGQRGKVGSYKDEI